MDNIPLKTSPSQKKLERTVLAVLTLYTLAMFFTSLLYGWSIYVKEFIFLPMTAGWFVYFQEAWNHGRRARFIAVMVWINFILFAINTDSFPSMLITMAGVIVLLSIFCIRQIVYLGLVIPIFIFLYHGLIARTISFANIHDILRFCIQFISLYTVSAVMWIIIRDRQDTSEQLLENIQELEIAERSKDDFLVNVSHEIRTPINAVCGLSEAILQENLPASVRRDVIDIQTAGRNLLSTVSNILDFSELESGRLELAEESYNITSTITDIINTAMTMDNGRHLELIVDCDANLPSNLLGDEQKLRRIILNLIGNAVKFTKEGGIILRIRSRKEGYGINLTVSVKDSGIGIKRADMEKIFTSFSQVDAKRNREEGGVGLGLAITQALVRSMGGFITVDSVPGTGSEFLFTVPQKVLDETPIVSIKNKKNLFAACYINLDKYNYSVIREGYENCINHIASQFGILFRACRNLPELKRRMENESYSHIFIGWEEYNEDRSFFEKLAEECTVVLFLNYGQEVSIRGNMLRIYKPFTVLSIAAVFNGQKLIQNEEQHIMLHNKFVAPTANILVVDDNAMNLKVMARLLLPYQIKVTMAGGGQEALNKLKTPEFDCVFLDHMMPEMDGVETLHKIRQNPSAYYQSLPVIAFTANAIGGAREMFLSEGFNDFIAKPIELSVLERLLRRYIPIQKQQIVEEETDSLSVSAAASPASPELAETTGNTQEESDSKALALLARFGINIEQGYAYCGDKEGFREIMGIFHAEGAKRQEQLAFLFQEQDWKNYVITVHALKGNAKGIGAENLSELARQLEMAGKENRIAYILTHHEELMEHYGRLLRALQDSAFLYPDGPPSPKQTAAVSKDGFESAASTSTATEVDEQSLTDLIVQLEEKLSSFENEGLKELLDRLAALRYCGTPLAGLSEKLRQMTADFDFLSASEALNAWKESQSGISGK